MGRRDKNVVRVNKNINKRIEIKFFYKKRKIGECTMDKKRIKIVFGIVLSILIICAGLFAGYVYWKKYGRRAEGSEGDYSKSRIVYLKEDRVRILNENYDIESEARTVNKYTKFKIFNNNFIILTSEEGNIAVVDITKLNSLKVTDEQKKLEISKHRNIFVINDEIIGILSDNGIYSEEKDEIKKISGKEIVKAVKDSEMKFYKIDKKGKIIDAVFEDIEDFEKTGKYISINTKEYILYFNKENKNKIENIIDKSNIKNNLFTEIKENKIKIYDVSGGEYPKKIFETDLDKDSFGVTENKMIVEVVSKEGKMAFKQYEFDKKKKMLILKSEIVGTLPYEMEILRVIDNKFFFKSIDGMGVNTELNFVDFEDNEAGVQNISSIDSEDIKYIIKKGENRYIFSEGRAIFEIDLSKRKVESGKSAYQKNYKTKYIYNLVKSNKNELFTSYSDNKNLYIEKNDFNKKSDFLKIEGITANSVELKMKQIEETPRGEKIIMWNKELFYEESEAEYTTIINKTDNKNKKINIADIKGVEYEKTGRAATSNMVYYKGKIYYVIENKENDLSATTETPIMADDVNEEAEESEEEKENMESGKFILYVTDENNTILEKYELKDEYIAEYMLINDEKIYMAGNSGLYIFDINKKELIKGEIEIEQESEAEYSLIKTKNKFFIVQKNIHWTEEELQLKVKLYEIDKNNGSEVRRYELEGNNIKKVVTYEDKIVAADGKEIKLYSEELKPIDKISLKEEIEFMEISGCRVYAAGRYMSFAEINLETGEIMREEYIPNLADADYINLLFTE